MSVLIVLHTAMSGDADAQYRDTVLTAVRSIAHYPGWAGKLMAALLAIHSMSSSDRMRALVAMEEAPEQALPSALHGVCGQVRVLVVHS